MAIAAPAMPAAASASQPQTLEEAAEALHAEYGLIRDTISRNRALTTRRMGPYFRAEVFHEPLIPRFSLATRENIDQSTVAENLSHTAANYWHLLLFTPEVEIPTAVKDTLKKFGVTEPSDDNVTLTAGNFTVYRPAFRQMYNAVTTDLTLYSDLILGANYRRGRVPVDGYDQTNDSMYSNTFLYHQRSTHINMTVHPPPLAYLKEVKTGRWRATV